jgi:hypothetical protein
VVIARHEEPTYEHLDFTWAHNAHRLIYPAVMDVLVERSPLESSGGSRDKGATVWSYGGAGDGGSGGQGLSVFQ